MTVLAWINDEDIKAVRAEDGSEQLIVDGRVIPLTEDHFHASQQVINYAMSGKRGRKQMRAFWLLLANGGAK